MLLPPCSHYDVVPVAAEKEKEWLHGPFDGKIVDGWVHGGVKRGTRWCITRLGNGCLNACSEMV